MAKRKTTSVAEDNSPDFLVKPKKQFEADLIERIKIGIELFERPVNNQPEYAKLKSDRNFWHYHGGY